MTKTTPMMPPFHDFGAMVDFWQQQSNAMFTFNLQMMRAAMAPWEAMGLSPRAFINLGMVPSAVAATEAAMAPAGEPSSTEPIPADAGATAEAKAHAATQTKRAEQTGAAAARQEDAGTATETEAGAATSARKPSGLKAPRAAGADDLRRITGLGPKLQEALNDIGIYHFDQIAKWTEAETAWVDENVGGVRGRASRDGWARQAAALANGDKD